MRRIISAFLLLLAVCAPQAYAGEQQPTRVMVIASMHRFHQDHPTFDYETLYRLVRAQEPDFVGVEIRSEDIRADESYLAKSYPPEMIALMKEWGTRAFGFDWLGPEIAGRPIPDNYWKELSLVKRLERQLRTDKSMDSPEDDKLAAAQRDVLKGVTAASLTDGRYHQLVQERRRIFAKMAGAGTYAPVVAFTEERERHIGDNIVRMVVANPGKSFVLVMGADHHGYAVERLKSEFGDLVKVVTPQ